MYECGVKWLDFPSYFESMVKLRKTENVHFGECIRPLLSRKMTLAAFSRDDPTFPDGIRLSN
jgi:hypothetical protein